MAVPRIKSSDFIGHRFGRLLITSVQLKKIGGKTRSVMSATCDCGTVKEYLFCNLRKGVTRSCGCYNSDVAINSHKQQDSCEGHSRHPLYCVWQNIIRRCYTETAANYNRYGGRGVSVCDEWKTSYIRFYNWAINNGWAKGLQVDKDIIGNGKLYSPETCCFVTPQKNSRHKSTNRSIVYEDQEKTLQEWCEILDLKYTTVRKRLLSGMNPGEAFSKARKKRYA